MVGAPAEAPNSKPPSKSRSRNTKHQARNSREAPNSQIPSSKGGPRFGAWDFFGVWSLVFAVGGVSSVFRCGYLQEAQVMPHAHRTKPDVEIGEGDPEQTHPRPEHVSAIETAHAAVRLLTERRPGKLIDAAADKVPQGMT